jgi:hypothetical protein
MDRALGAVRATIRRQMWRPPIAHIVAFGGYDFLVSVLR